MLSQWWKFEPTSVCAESCPGGFNLASPTKYGGPSYPCSKYGDGCVVPEFFYTFRTRDIIDRCLPTADTQVQLEKMLVQAPRSQTATALVGHADAASANANRASRIVAPGSRFLTFRLRETQRDG